MNNDLESLHGTVTRVTYYSEETYFGVINIKLDYQDKELKKYREKLFTNILTVTCNFERKPQIDEEYDFTGEFITNQYGIQFKAKTYSIRNANTFEGIVAYLSSDLFPGIGRASATKIYNELGKDTIELIEKDKNVLNKVKGISDKQRETISENLKEHKLTKQVLIELLDLGITMRTSLKLYNTLGADVVKMIKANPYQLTRLVEGFGFRRADKIAMEVGIAENSDIRIKSLLEFLLIQYINQSGNIYINSGELYDIAVKEVNQNFEIINKENYERNIKYLVVEKQIIIENDNVYDYWSYQSERLLAYKLKEFLNTEPKHDYEASDVEKMIARLEEEHDIIYNSKQKEAIKTSLLENIVIITGGPGTGKSTIVKAIIESFSRLYPSEAIRDSIALLAPTGRAAKRLKEMTGHDGQTIHRFLGYEGDGRFKLGYGDFSNCRIVIVDEFSMVDLSLAARLFTSLEDNTRVIIVGDVDQLPSVSPGQVLSDLIMSKEITTIKLDQIHRQAEDSTIISLAHEVNQGRLPEEIFEKYHDRNFIKMKDEDIVANIIKTIEQAQKSGMDLVKDIQVLIPMYKGEVGINLINQRLQEKFNPKTNQEIKHATRVFRVNDKVIQLVNRNEKQVMNGDIGYILNFIQEDGEVSGLSVMFDFGSVDYKKDELDDLAHAYAISIHKSQGSEFNLIILPFSYKYYIMLKRKLIYTAITRAKKYLIMLGSIEAMLQGVRTVENRRNTSLVERLKQALTTKEELELEEIITQEEVSPFDFLD